MISFKVFSGWDRRQAEAAEVFKYSVEQNASIDVDIRFLQIDKLPISRHGVTEFSYSRFLVPFLCGYEGRAMFADGCDQLCLGDVAELAAWDMQGKPVWVVKHPARRHDRARSWTSLMLLDCRQFQRWTPAYVEAARDDRLMRLRDLADDQIGELPGEWNTLVGEGPLTPLVYPDLTKLMEGKSLKGVKLLHWSYLSAPEGGSWIDRSGSGVWSDWRARWRASRDQTLGNQAGRPPAKAAAAASA